MERSPARNSDLAEGQYLDARNSHDCRVEDSGGFCPAAKTRRLRNASPQAGAILMGKTNMHEFAYGVTNDNPHFGPARNPWNRERITGGSSGGSAAAIANGMCFASVGSDTGGSIRIPSALCGVVGLKPTFGLVSVAGIVPLAHSLDHAGPLAGSVTDACIMLEAIAGEYPKGTRDPTIASCGAPCRSDSGWAVRRLFLSIAWTPKCARLIEAAAKVFHSLGARIENVADAAARRRPSSGHERHRARRSHALPRVAGIFPDARREYGGDVRQRLEQGSEVRAVDYLRGLAMRAEAEKDFQAAFERVDAHCRAGRRRSARRGSVSRKWRLRARRKL